MAKARIFNVVIEVRCSPNVPPPKAKIVFVIDSIIARRLLGLKVYRRDSALTCFSAHSCSK